MTCPVIASDSVLNGLRGEYRQGLRSTCVCLVSFIEHEPMMRRIEDKLNQMQMEAKVVQVMFDTATLQGNRILATTLHYLVCRFSVCIVVPKLY